MGRNTAGFHLLSPSALLSRESWEPASGAGTAHQKGPQHPGMVRGCGCAPMSVCARCGGWWGLAGQLPSEFSRDSWSCRWGQDVTSPAREKPSAPSFSNETPASAGAQRLSLPLPSPNRRQSRRGA